MASDTTRAQRVAAMRLRARVLGGRLTWLSEHAESEHDEKTIERVWKVFGDDSPNAPTTDAAIYAMAELDAAREWLTDSHPVLDPLPAEERLRRAVSQLLANIASSPPPHQPETGWDRARAILREIPRDRWEVAVAAWPGRSSGRRGRPKKGTASAKAKMVLVALLGRDAGKAERPDRTLGKTLAEGMRKRGIPKK